MSETTGSRLCEQSIDHFRCLGCPCWCHPSQRSPGPVWEAEPVQISCRGMTVHPEPVGY